MFLGKSKYIVYSIFIINIVLIYVFKDKILNHFYEKQFTALIKKNFKNKVTFEAFFENATLNPNAHLITGVICGYRIEEIENPLTQKVRYLDKLIDELAKGRKMEKILRVA